MGLVVLRQDPIVGETSVPVLSLFSGAGGLDYGFHQAKFSPLLAVDNNTAATRTFNANFSGQLARCGDLSSLPLATLASWLSECGGVPKGVIGGPPCQGFSFGNTTASPDDPRNLLPQNYSKIVGWLNRKFGLDFFVFENVMGLRSKKHHPRLSQLKKSLDTSGFNVFQGELDAYEFGVPQRRKRIFLVGLNRRTFPGREYVFPSGGKSRKTVRDALSDLPDPVYRKHGMSPGDIPFHPNHWTMAPRSQRFAQQDFNQGRSFRRLDWDQPSWTVAYGNREIHVHPSGQRRLSILEAMLLQSFPRKFVLKGNFSEQVQQVSNAVPPLVARAVARSLRKQLYA